VRAPRARAPLRIAGTLTASCQLTKRQGMHLMPSESLSSSPKPPARPTFCPFPVVAVCEAGRRHAVGAAAGGTVGARENWGALHCESAPAEEVEGLYDVVPLEAAQRERPVGADDRVWWQGGEPRGWVRGSGLPRGLARTGRAVLHGDARAPEPHIDNLACIVCVHLCNCGIECRCIQRK
jgi:hypothetical protein